MGTRGIPPVSHRMMFCLALLGVACGTAWATSGIRFEGPTMLDASNPPCNAARATTYQMTLKNINCVCNEDVRVNLQSKAADGLNEIDTDDTPKGSFKFIGFSESQGGPFSSGNFQFPDMEDESSKTIFFQVETGPVDCIGGQGGDFTQAKFGIVICDTGGGCDILDGPCEGPTKFLPIVTLNADTSVCPQSDQGTGVIHVSVQKSDGKPTVGGAVNVTRGCKGSPGAVDRNGEALTPKTNPANWGKYDITNLPFPATYELKVRADGLCNTQSVDLPAAGTLDVQVTLLDQCL
jgi:hypothetical protein